MYQEYIMEKWQSLQQMILRKLDIYMPKNVIGPLNYIIHKIQYKTDLILKFKTQTVELLEESIEMDLHDIGLGNNFMDMTQKAKVKKAKLDK